jgi:hypothetical protein
MPLSDLFKKSPKKEPIKNDPFGTPEMQKKRHDAAMEFVQIFQEKIPLLRGKPHAGTVLAVSVRLAGSSLYRSLNPQKDIAPGVVVLSNEVNEAWPQLMNIFAFYCKQNGFDVMSKPMVTTFPEQNKPLMDVEQVLAEYQDQYHEIMKKHGLDYLDGARAGMIVCSIVFQYHCTKIKDIDPYVAAGIIAMGIVEGAKTAPPPLKPGGSSVISPPASVNKAQNDQFMQVAKDIAKSSTSGSGTKLVLGEGMTSMREAMTKGGKYILVNPGVVDKLKQNNIDPYLVYEAALRIEVESKIPQIDFVGENVDDLLREWGAKPQNQIPVHVRRLLWLNANAASLGYQRSGNSWALK